MSRLEEAMEKARQLRERETSPNASEERKPKLPTLPRPAPPTEKIEVSNHLLFAASNFDVSAAEEYRKLKSVIVHATKKKDGFHNTLMVTSSVSGEGKSLTALNLAISLAHEHDHTVLLVDGDLRNPAICNYLGLEAKKGLANCLIEGMPLSEALIKTGLGNLTVLPAGKQMANPVELFSSQKTKELIDEIKHRYPDRYIIFDMPPTLPFAETRLLGSIVDGVIFVVKEGGTSLDNITEALASLKDANVLGIVYNAATASSLSDGSHYYYGKYGYRSKDKDSAIKKQDRKPGLFSRIRKRKGQLNSGQ